MGLSVPAERAAPSPDTYSGKRHSGSSLDVRSDPRKVEVVGGWSLLSTRQGANARLCADSGPRTSACTDICALACTTNNAPDVSALGDIPGPSLRDRYAQGGGSEIGQAEGGLRAGAVSPTLRVRLPP